MNGAAAIHWQCHGPATAETVVLSAGLGGSGNYWAPQIPALAERYRVLVYDHFGTGRSRGEIPEFYTVADMARELETVLDDADIPGPVHFVGHALGGLIGLELARRAPERIGSLLLINAWAEPNAHTRRCFSVRRKLLLSAGPEAYLEAQPLFLYPPVWIAEHSEHLEQEQTYLLASFPPRDNLLRRMAALQAWQPAPAELAQIRAHALVLATRDDALVPWTCSQKLAARLPNSSVRLLPTGGHAVNVTEPDRVNALVLDHLRRHRLPATDRITQEAL
ncbi:pyrimidine utilization protein D [Marinobacter lutaoensis]|jgi:aminoacrylate hydrolase|uniref:Putative carbamate hydrolase RutD n=1 Tax=Marinobacter lutaoensis TaxID=135739 RepID=A0A1V2DU01_9GAMM|nr:pyrimidine utilization protein D [Marinobacter lutaoensis]MBE03082.1 pyrimidine utilization protein D [Marinobacter sp.]MBI42478.1 pyrimidine utilization protein D [Oceanospirillales bacterium]NVD35464.1 pyrimidine utilization protein D [Marinobacter lutaoensis]ONF44132.1 pyrimidine utilization protein D [Marinobacter lutaoensis]|tara:strand:- start:704 stop:1537 length:834 start_codon:yes stop_codon:yes gene_type:complete